MHANVFLAIISLLQKKYIYIASAVLCLLSLVKCKRTEEKQTKKFNLSLWGNSHIL